jgi:hypothetical protein
MSRPTGLVAAAFALSLLSPKLAPAQQETPITPGSLDTGEGFSLFKEGAGHRTILNGFGVGTFSYNGATDQSSFSASALAISLYHPITDDINVFGQVTVSREGASPFLEDQSSSDGYETEIDNLQASWRSPSAGFDVTFGKFDSPLAIERDDAPLNFQATESFTFQYARPVKFTGLAIHEAFSSQIEAWAIVANGWDVSQDNNRAKTAALYAVWSPSLSGHIGLGVIHGAEKDDRSGDPRTTAVATYLFQPAESWIWGGEIVAGQERGSAPDGSTARWFATMFFTHYRFTRHWAATFRADYMDDEDGARTGTRQVLQSLTLSPQYLVGGGFYGVFRYLDRTSLRLPEFQVRLDLRKDRSTERVFASRRAGVGRRDSYSATLQTVFLF